MTEAEWLACEYPDFMLRDVQDSLSERKQLLTAVGWCRLVERLTTPERIGRLLAYLESIRVPSAESLPLQEITKLLDVAEQDADAPGPGTPNSAKSTASQIADSVIQCLQNVPESEREHRATRRALEAILCGVADRGGDVSDPVSFAAMNAAPEDEASQGVAVRGTDAAMVALLRDIAGNPFRPATFDPNWRTSTAVALAQRIYDAKDFTLMPILADALQDAGCASDDVLDHCREPHGVHVRGCWVVDAVLNKV